MRRMEVLEVWEVLEVLVVVVGTVELSGDGVSGANGRLPSIS